jgi:hypothetical protein
MNTLPFIENLNINQLIGAEDKLTIFVEMLVKGPTIS